MYLKIACYDKSVPIPFKRVFLLIFTGSNVAPRAMPFWGVAKTSGVGISR